MTPECQRLLWLATYNFTDEGEAARDSFAIPSLKRGHWGLRCR